MGNALLEIQTRRLYLDDGYNTFEQYCAKRWSISRSQAYRMIQAAEVVGHLGEDRAVPLPIHEAQTRVLARLKEPEAMRAVWEEVVDEYGETASGAEGARRGGLLRGDSREPAARRLAARTK